MGMIGDWIDSLTDEQRDAIITHPDPTYYGDWWWSYERECGCLVGCVVALEIDELAVVPCTAAWTPMSVAICRCIDKRAENAGVRFVTLTQRFGAERVWRACKMRAARANGSSKVALPEHVPDQPEALATPGRNPAVVAQ